MTTTVTESEWRSVCEYIDQTTEELVEFLLEFANKQSPSGHERDASDFLAEWMDQRFGARQQFLSEHRTNVVGSIGGHDPAAGHSLIYNAHIDTAFGNESKDEWITAEPHRVYYESWRDGDHLYGDDIANDKGPLSAFLWAALAIGESGIELGEELHLTAVAGEIQSSPVDEFQGPEFFGTGFGTRHLLTQGGITGEYAVVAETTDYAIGRMECGLAQFKLVFTDDVEYWPRLEYPSGDESENQGEDGGRDGTFPGALHDACRAVLLLDEWAADYRQTNSQDFGHGVNRPSAGVGGMRSGVPYSPGHAPGKAAVYLTVFLPPNRRPELVRDEVRELLTNAGFDPDIELYNFGRGYVADDQAVAPLVDTIDAAHGTVRGDATPQPDPAVVSMWRDINLFNEVGVPAVTFGPARTTEEYSGTKHRCMHVDDLAAAAKLYAYVALETCGTTE